MFAVSIDSFVSVCCFVFLSLAYSGGVCFCVFFAVWLCCCLFVGCLSSFHGLCALSVYRVLVCVVACFCLIWGCCCVCVCLLCFCLSLCACVRVAVFVFFCCWCL